LLTGPLISLITPVYNRASLLAETIESILSQTYENWELILVDDGSDEATLTLLYSYEKKDDRIKVLQRNRLPKGAQTLLRCTIEMVRKSGKKSFSIKQRQYYCTVHLCRILRFNHE
jgi:glycosyltransferase involved in cell wall biosynthesis